MLQFQLMKQLVFSTGNDEKFLTAKHVCDGYSIQLTQQSTDIPEIQSEDPKKVALDKAAKAFALAERPVIITDDSWAFMGLKGFPGVYMHSMNHWFTPDDFLRLVMPLKDRRAILTQYLVFQDNTGPKVFTRTTEGVLLTEIRGISKIISDTIITLVGDNGLSIAEVYERSRNKSTRKSAMVWHDFVEWFSKHSS
jgi:non-canonical purine NTP pyrophosphatase (RdgB/HAM1 family)